MDSVQKIVERVMKDELHTSWSKQHSKSFLTHLFSGLSADYVLNSDWEIGFYDPESSKITVFVVMKNGKIAIKPADDVFKKPDATVEKLKLEEVKLSFEEAVIIAKEEFPKQFHKEIMGDGFLVVQTFQNDTIWNFTFITKSLKFVNVKINSKDGKINSAESFSVLDQGNKK